MRPTIHTVADKAGVSIATVSRYLNGSARVSPATAAKVQRAVDELGYVPNAAARGLATNTTHAFAFVYPRPASAHISALISGAEQGAHENEYHLLIHGAVPAKPDNPDRVLDLLGTRVDGVILASESIRMSFLQDLQRRRVPVVMLGQKPGVIAADCIVPDNATGAEAAVTHLLGHGRRRIAMITSPANRPHLDDRERGYRTALRIHGIDIEPDLIVRDDFNEAGGYRAMAKLLARKPLPDAVFAVSDTIAIGALSAIHETILRIPQDIALIGFDDLVTARYLNPPLTTVHYDIAGAGRRAVDMLCARCDGSELPPQTILIPTRLITRRSCGCSP